MMSIDPTKMAGGFGIPSLQKIAADPADRNNQRFNQVLDRAVNHSKTIENSQLQAAELAKFAQLRLLQGLFSIDEGKADDGFYPDFQSVDLLQKMAAQQSQILDKYYANQQPSLLKPEQKGRSEIEQMIDQVAKIVSLAPELIRSVVTAESDYDPTAASHAGAQGLMQLMPATAQELGVQDSFDPLQNLSGGCRYLKQLLVKYDGDLDHALAAYNWGQGNVDRHGLKNMPEETRNYLAKVKNLLEPHPT
ncbi:MAG: lytic transglycosylase domain-containing protein [Desulfuromusa sp.]|nr:lytic transglycosylase domain-containing protein [Desulfuromusa sp.]